LQNLPPLLEKLAAVGIEQFIVPDGIGAEAARVLRDTQVRVGLVLEWHHILTGAELVDVPSAALIPPTSTIEQHVGFLQAWAEIHPGQSIIVFATPGRTINDRPLEQIIATTAPYPEEHLVLIAKREAPQ
jgi:hypothetical protein